MQKFTENPSFVFDAELLDEKPVASHDVYDAMQVQQTIVDSDSLKLLAKSITQSAFLVGGQVTAVQIFYYYGVTGLFPGLIAGLPAGASLINACSCLSIDGGVIRVEDKRKLGLSISKTALLSLTSIQANWQQNELANIANDGLQRYQQDVNTYEGVQPADNQWVGIGVVAALAIALIFVLRGLTNGKR